MKSTPACLLALFVTAAAALPHAWAQKEIVIRHLDVDGPPMDGGPRHDAPPLEKEKVTFLGVSTAPVNRTLSSQLGLPQDFGLVVVHVLEKSPAAEVLKEDDVLIRLDDQVLVDSRQLSVLIRAKREGEEVKLAVMRGGKELALKAKLSVHEVPKSMVFLPHPGAEGDFPGFERLQELPGFGPEHARDVMRMIDRERGRFLEGPGIHIMKRKGKGSTVLDMPNSNISYSDDEGAIEIKSDDKQRTLTIKDAKGKVTFQGPINTPEEREKLPPEVRQQLEKLNADSINLEDGQDFKTEVVPGPAKTKIMHHPRSEAAPAPDHAMQPL
jgi:serine protease Do